jgi:universal stress protein F
MFKHILLAVDLNRPESWEEALPVVESLAGCYSSEVTLCAISTAAEAVETGDWWPNSYQDRIAEKHSELDTIAGRVAGDIKVNVEVGTGTVDSGLIDVADRIGADLIVLTPHHYSLIDRLLPTHSGGLSRNAGCSVLVLR